MKTFIHVIFLAAVLAVSCKEPAEVRFDPTSGEGKMNSIVCSVGDTVTIPKNEFSKEGFVFSEWNTKKDGSGISVKDQSSIRVTQPLTILYARWTDVREISVSDLKADVATPESVLLTWTLSGMPSADYWVIYKTGESETAVDLAAAGFETPEKGVRINGLTAGTEYTFTVTAVFDTLEGTGSVSAFPVPQPASDLKAVINDTPGEVVLSWSSSTTEDVTYKICYGKTAADTVYDGPVSGNTLTLTGLDCGSEYRFAVRAVKEGIEGPAAEATAATKKLLQTNGFNKEYNSVVELKFSEVVNFEADTVVSARMYITFDNSSDTPVDITADFGITDHVVDNSYTTFVDPDSGESIGGDFLLMIYGGSGTLSGNCTFRLEFKDSNYYDSVCEWTVPISAP